MPLLSMELCCLLCHLKCVRKRFFCRHQYNTSDINIKKTLNLAHKLLCKISLILNMKPCVIVNCSYSIELT